MKDKLVLGAGAGFAGAWVMTALIYLLNIIPGVSIEMIDRLSTLFINGIATTQMPAQFFGVMAHLVCGSIVGLIYLIVLDYFGSDLPIIKGTAAGLVTWFLLCGIVSRFLGLQLSDKFTDAFLLMLVHIPYGITTVWLIHRWGLTENKELRPQ